jgi:hypothetical protein
VKITVRLEKSYGNFVCEVEIDCSSGERPEIIVRDGVAYKVHGFGSVSGPRRPAPYSYRQTTAVFVPLDSTSLLPIGDTILPDPMVEPISFVNGREGELSNGSSN